MSIRNPVVEPRSSVNEEREILTKVITRWNEHRLDLFEISLPNENLDFFGVIRFYFHDNQQSVATTKCLRVSSTAVSKMVIDALIEKFRPDMRMLGSSYALYEVHQSGEERKLQEDERPLVVQLNWSKGDRDGRFVFKQVTLRGEGPLSPSGHHSSPKNPFSLKGKKDKRKKKRFSSSSSKSSHHLKKSDSESDDQKPGSLAKAIYKAVPDSRFTRSISNPEAVMRRQRQQKLVKKLQSMRGKDGRPASGGTLRVYAGSLVPEEPYKTLLVSNKANTSQVIKLALDKYGILHENPSDYCLVQMTVPLTASRNVHLNVIGGCTNQRMLREEEQPLELFNSWMEERRESVVIFQLQKKNSVEYLLHGDSMVVDSSFMPYLVEVSSEGQDFSSARKIHLTMDHNILGSKQPSTPSSLSHNFIHVNGPEIRPQHCDISNIEGVFTICPVERNSEIRVNNKVIRKHAFLSHNYIIKLGRYVSFRYIDHFASNRVAALTEANCGETHPASATAELLNSMSGGERESPVSPQPYRERSQSHSALEDHQQSNRRSSNELEHKLRATLSAEFDQIEKKDVPKDESIGTGHVNAVSMPAFPVQFNSPPGTLKSCSESLLSSDVSEGEPLHLPMSLVFHPTKEGPLLSNMILELKLSTLQFTLAPAFSLYMIVRYHLTADFQPGANASELKKHLIVMLKNTVSYLKRAIKEARNTVSLLAFWMANTSEFLHFLKQDQDISRLTYEYESPLTNLIQSCYKHFYLGVTRDLTSLIPALFDSSEEVDIDDGSLPESEDQPIGVPPDVISNSWTTGGGSNCGTPHGTLTKYTSSTSSMSSRNSRKSRRSRTTVNDIMSVLSLSLSTLHKNNVNMSLAMRLFSQLIRFLNAKIFNMLLSEAKYCTRSWGLRLRKRLERIKQWAKKHRLEATTDRYLATSLQACTLLSCSKYYMEDLKHLGPITHLNSLQIDTLIKQYQLEEGEPQISKDFVAILQSDVKAKRDHALMRDRGIIPVEEEGNFNVLTSFILPEFGYIGQAVKGIPPGLEDFLRPFISIGLCKVVLNVESPGLWTYLQASSHNGVSGQDELCALRQDMMSSPVPPGNTPSCSTATESDPRLPPITEITVKKVKNSLGISITGGKYSSNNHPNLDIYVKKLVTEGAAEKDGRLQPGDQILGVDNQSLQGLTQEHAAQILKNTGDTVKLTIAQQAAQYYGLTHLINQPSPAHARKNNTEYTQDPKPSQTAKLVKKKMQNLQPKQLYSTNVSLQGRNLTESHSNGDVQRESQAPMTHLFHNGVSYEPSSRQEEGKPSQLVIPSSPYSESTSIFQQFTQEEPTRDCPSIDLEKTADSGFTRDGDHIGFSFLTHDTQQLSSQPQPSNHPQAPAQPNYDPLSMDVQHPSLASSSVPTAMSVIQRYESPVRSKEEALSPVPAGNPVARQQRNLDTLRGMAKEYKSELAIFEDQRSEEERRREQLEMEFQSVDFQGPVGPRDEMTTQKYKKRQLKELEEKRRNSNERLKDIEVKLHNKRTRLQGIEHQIKMIELSLDAEESERKIEELNNNDYGTKEKLEEQPSNKPERKEISNKREGETRAISQKGREAKVIASPVVKELPVTDSLTAHQRQVNESSIGHQKDQQHTRHRNGSSDSSPKSGRHGSASSEGHRSLERHRNGPIRNDLPMLSIPKNPEADPSQVRRSPNKRQMEEIRYPGNHNMQAGVGEWTHTHQRMEQGRKNFKPSSSSDSAGLLEFKEEQFSRVRVYNLSPTSESDFSDYPRPPPPGVDWQNQPQSGSNPKHDTNLKKWNELKFRKQGKPNKEVLSPRGPFSPGGKQFSPSNQQEMAFRFHKNVPHYQHYNMEGDHRGLAQPDSYFTKGNLQFHQPLLSSQEITSSQVTSYPDDMATPDPYNSEHVTSETTRDSEPVNLAQEESADELTHHKSSFEITSPRVVPVTRGPPQSHHNQRSRQNYPAKKPPPPSSKPKQGGRKGNPMSYREKMDFLMNYKGTTVSKTDL